MSGRKLCCFLCFEAIQQIRNANVQTRNAWNRIHDSPLKWDQFEKDLGRSVETRVPKSQNKSAEITPIFMRQGPPFFGTIIFSYFGTLISTLWTTCLNHHQNNIRTSSFITFISKFLLTISIIFVDKSSSNRYPPVREASRGLYWNQAQKKFHPPIYWVPLGVCHSVTLSLCNSITL